MTEETTAPQQAELNRRTVVKGAAWSLPVLAAAVAVPMAAATGTTPWNVSITQDCVIDAGGSGFLVPGFQVKADPNTQPIPGTLFVTETAAGSWSLTLPAPTSPIPGVGVDPTLVPGFQLAFETFAFGYATAIVAATVLPAAFGGLGPSVSGPNWVNFASIGDYLSWANTERTYSGSGLLREVTLTTTFDLSRQLQLNGLIPGQETYWGYPAGIVVPDVTGVPGFNAIDTLLSAIPVVGPAWSSAVGSLSPQLSLTAVGGWSDAAADHSAQITNIFGFSC